MDQLSTAERSSRARRPVGRRGLQQSIIVLVAVCGVGLRAVPVIAAKASQSVAAGAFEEESVSPVGPPLTALPSKISDSRWLVAYLSKPSRLQPGTLMPDFAMKPDEVKEVVRFLYPSAEPAASAAATGGDVRQGQLLFVARGCKGCHGSVRGEPSLSARIPQLAGVGLKVRADWLGAWLKSPRSYNAHTAMPRLTLSDEDIRHLTAYLMSRREGESLVRAAQPPAGKGDAAAGRAVIEHYGCAGCHEVDGFPKPPAPLAALPSDGTDGDVRRGRLLVSYYGCRGCHRIEGRGGRIANYLERKTFAPPTLEDEGKRVQTSWLVEFLQAPGSLRPWMRMHMPDYGLSKTEAQTLARFFAALAGIPAQDEPHPPVAEDVTIRGLRRLAHYKCVQCHPLGDEVPAADPEDQAINLSLARIRLRPSWVRAFLANPKKLIGTQTRMPAVFYTSDGMPRVEHPEQDIDSITAYLMHATEPLDVALERQKAQREAARGTTVDWSKVQY
jgi:mono/diheme cytochrome c family protein